MGSVSVSSCRCCVFVSCVHPVAVLNAAFCMTFSLLMLWNEQYIMGDAITINTVEGREVCVVQVPFQTSHFSESYGQPLIC